LTAGHAPLKTVLTDTERDGKPGLFVFRGCGLVNRASRRRWDEQALACVNEVRVPQAIELGNLCGRDTVPPRDAPNGISGLDPVLHRVPSVDLVSEGEKAYRERDPQRGEMAKHFRKYRD
jgi:hypothetical protein